MARKLSLIFVTLFLVVFKQTGSGKLLSHNTGVIKIPPAQIISKNAFLGLNRKKNTESNTPSSFKDPRRSENAVVSRLAGAGTTKLVLVASSTLVLAVTVYRFVSKLVNYYLYGRYQVKDGPGVANTIGHALLKNTPDVPSDAFVAKVVNPVCKVFERLPLYKGFVRPGMRRVSTASVVDKDTLVAVYFYNDYIHKTMKEFGVDFVENLKSSYESLRRSGKKVEVVFVNMSTNNDLSYETFKGLPWYSVPFGDTKTKHKLATMFNTYYLPSMVLLDSDGNIVKEKCLNLLFYKINDFPWKDVKFLDLLPDYLTSKSNEQVPKSRLQGKYVGVLFDFGNPELQKKIKEKLRSLYQYMNNSTDGNFEIVTLNMNEKSKDFQESMEQNDPSWVSLKFGDRVNGLMLAEMLQLDDFNRFVLLDQEGKVYTKFAQFLLDEKLYPSLLNEYSKGSEKVKGDGLVHCHIMNRPVLIVLAENDDTKTQENLDVELNKALMAHKEKHKGHPFQFLLLKNKKTCEFFRKHLYLNKKAKMIAISSENKVFNFKGDEVNEKSVLGFLEDFYNSL